MTDQHRATPEQWACQKAWADDYYSSCILELRARVKALEAAQQDKLDRLIALDREDPTPDPAMPELHTASAEAQPGGLVERVEIRAGGDGRAAIREVAAWLEAESEAHLGSGKHWAKRLNQEASQ